MEIVCRNCQGIVAIDYRQVFKLEEDFFVTYCPGCDSENEVWDVYDWLDPPEIEYIEKYNNLLKDEDSET